MRRLSLALLLILCCCAFPARTSAQSLVELYRKQQLDESARQIFARYGMRARPAAAEALPVRSEKIRQVLAIIDPPPPPPPPPKPAFRAEKWRFVRRLESLAFRNRYSGVKWAYSGSNRFVRLDTTWTRELRGRLEGHFGPPTETLVENGPSRDGRYNEYIQFEYWFVVNDSIPVVAMDANGPFDRGLVIATDQKYRNLLPALRDELFREINRTNRVAPYVDYYYERERKAWFRTGYDGRHYFTRQISAPSLAQGRPRIEDERRAP